VSSPAKAIITILALGAFYALLEVFTNPAAPDYYRENAPHQMEATK
jgi:hypothetical protein